jgi:hypothetical protein
MIEPQKTKSGWSARLWLEAAIHLALLGALWEHFREHWRRRKLFQ